MLAVAVPAPLRPTLLAVHSCTRQHANLLVPGQIVPGLVHDSSRAAEGQFLTTWNIGSLYLLCIFTEYCASIALFDLFTFL
jgi:hypothetical protein